MTTQFNPPRPTANYEIKLAAAYAFLKEHPYIQDGMDEQDTLDLLADDLAMHSHESIDGYALAKNLEDAYHWEDIGAETVSQLDDFGSYIRTELLKAETKWATENHIEPPYPVGSRVQFFRGCELMQGVITEIDQHFPACYQIKTDHSSDNCRSIIKFEHVRLPEPQQEQ